MASRTLIGLARCLALLGMAVLGLLTALPVVTMIALSFGLGAVFLFPSAVRMTRGHAQRARLLALGWTGVEIPPPYRPEPPMPLPGRDGWYHHAGQRYRTALVPLHNQNLSWMIKDPATWRDLLWLLADPVIGGVIAAAPPAMVGGGAVLVASWHPLLMAAGVLLMVAGMLLAPWAVRVHAMWTSLLLAPTHRARLTNEVRHLTRSRMDANDAQAAELRRIERDLHDGAQARLVAMGMTLGAAEELMESDPKAAKALLAKVREASAESLVELRRLVRGIHPPLLAERGLGDAVRALALDSPLRVEVAVDLEGRADAPVESATYFAVSELLANAARHGDAQHVTVDLSRRGKALRVTVVDDGRGGADPTRGTGLRGIERRLAAFDGVLALNSPPGGPTTATIEIPDALPGAGERLEEDVPPWKKTVTTVCWSLCWLPLFPQGLVTAVVKVTGGERSWFLGMHVPGPYQWPVIIGMITLGLGMLGTGLYVHRNRHGHGLRPAR
ncbi:sensor histidine kinase [Sphaerisporangium sp. TRM90804]|uniref:sensor histidine kinase n=1 Tax=Sphaerisporangium sp. TRM90804 TaxID=3031113 RepID=UPI00244D111C|nr:sensor histidine kinase [Sphaerisporangium sp. TRM90804]MDH2425521.1 histidine kinase [Sphaerisporangium sp. TRM90804]